MQQHPDFDCRRGKQSSRTAPYGTRRTSSQLDIASSQSSHSDSLHEKDRGHGSAKVPATDNGLASWVTDDMKKTFNTIYRKHGSLKERRDLNIKYHHVVCQQCITKNKPCEIRPTALQCGNCPPYVKCTRVPTLKKLRVLDMMNISEEQYDWLLTWYKKTAEEELLEPLKESLKLTSASVTSSARNSMISPKSRLPHTSLAPLNESHSHETENSTDTQFHKIGDWTDYRTVNVLATNDVTYGYSVPREYSSAPITPVSTQPSPASYSQNQQLPQDRFFTPAVPYYTPSLSYPSPSPRLLAPTALYRTLDSFYQESNEDSCSASAQSSGESLKPSLHSSHLFYVLNYVIALAVNPSQYPTVTWSCHDPRAYPTISEPIQPSITYDERAHYITNRQTCVDAEFEFGGYDRVSKSAPESLHYPTYSGEFNVFCPRSTRK
ncbi:MAG: hypothetical protein NXY57DRAFT_388543 [Lentinula lateritia]|nr:MAG: hypothetical protein NXY57DRAFT_388543 [Lentinula lateritia]